MFPFVVYINRIKCVIGDKWCGWYVLTLAGLSSQKCDVFDDMLGFSSYMVIQNNLVYDKEMVAHKFLWCINVDFELYIYTETSTIWVYMNDIVFGT